MNCTSNHLEVIFMTLSGNVHCCGYKTRFFRDYDDARINSHTWVFVLKKLLEYATLMMVGGLAYYGVEILYRGFSHWSMMILGGLCLICVGVQNELKCMSKLGIIPQMAVGAIIITVLEFIAGCILNLWLGWEIWDYSNVPGNILGQICLPFTGFWFLLSGVAIVVDDWIRVVLFKEKRWHYDWFWCNHANL